ncbi:100 kDa protein [Pigeon adenovirus 2a]|nr:100 kDa protein [Pigeon adenovirus 2a]
MKMNKITRKELTLTFLETLLHSGGESIPGRTLIKAIKHRTHKLYGITLPQEWEASEVSISVLASDLYGFLGEYRSILLVYGTIETLMEMTSPSENVAYGELENQHRETESEVLVEQVDTSRTTQEPEMDKTRLTDIQTQQTVEKERENGQGTHGSSTTDVVVEVPIGKLQAPYSFSSPISNTGACNASGKELEGNSLSAEENRGRDGEATPVIERDESGEGTSIRTVVSVDSYDRKNNETSEEENEGRVEHDEGRGLAGAGPNLRNCLRRQAQLLAGALREAQLLEENTTLSVEGIQLQLERFVFNPDPKVPREQAEVRYNFYPPFLTPKAICNYHIFTVTAAIPSSCKANRSGTELLRARSETRTFRRLPRWNVDFSVDDGLGDDVVPVTELREDVKLVQLQNDTSRLQWAKCRSEHVQFFSYPSLHLPPKLTRLMMETLLQPFCDEINEKASEPEMCISDEEIASILDPAGKMPSTELHKAIAARRTAVTMAIRYCLPLTLMQRFFREPSMVRKCQEVLHHTLHQGYVQLIREVGKVNLSNYSTFHGVTYNNPLNNSVVSRLLEGEDKRDYTLDTIYLFLVMTWQTAMGMWQQAIDDSTIKAYENVFVRATRELYSLSTVTDMCDFLANILMDGDRLMNELRKAFPNFTSQSQISNFRHFIMERSNLPPFGVPLLPTDMIPLAFKESPHLLWDQVYLLELAFFLLNHGGYLWEPSTERPSLTERVYCPCNLCAPHRMPSDNVALHNEVLAIGTFEIRSAEGKTFSLTPELWTNAYLDKFEPDDFFPFYVCHYVIEPKKFTKERVACVTPSPEILSLIRQIEKVREEFLLTKGKGGYRDPKTGESLTDVGAGARCVPRSSEGLPTLTARFRGGVQEEESASRALRSKTRNGASHGAGDVGTENVCDGEGRCSQNNGGRGGGYRRRIAGQSGQRFGGRNGRRNGESRASREGDKHPIKEKVQPSHVPKEEE